MIVKCINVGEIESQRDKRRVGGGRECECPIYFHFYFRSRFDCIMSNTKKQFPLIQRNKGKRTTRKENGRESKWNGMKWKEMEEDGSTIMNEESVARISVKLIWILD